MRNMARHGKLIDLTGRGGPKARARRSYRGEGRVGRREQSNEVISLRD